MKRQYAQNASISTSSTSTQILNQVGPGQRRMAFSVINTSTTAVVTVAKGEVSATQGAGFRLTPSMAIAESMDTAFQCWQGPIQAVSDVAGTVAITQVLEDI